MLIRVEHEQDFLQDFTKYNGGGEMTWIPDFQWLLLLTYFCVVS